MVRGKILLTGASGQVGGELLRMLTALGEVVAPARGEMDLGDAGSVRAMVREVQPRWVVNPGAYTAVDRAESEPELAYAVNRDAVRVMGEEARRVGAAVVHFSTDYVFAGSGVCAYLESDATGPVSVYGASKLAGEQALAESGAAHLIFRTSWVYGARGKNFLRTIVKLAREREVVRVVADQHGAPTWSRDLAAMTVAAMSQCEREAGEGGIADAVREVSGVYHAAGAGETSWYGFAMEAVRGMKEREPKVRWAEVEAIATAEFPTTAQRPANSRLDCGKLRRCFGWGMMGWQDSLREVLPEL